MPLDTRWDPYPIVDLPVILELSEGFDLEVKAALGRDGRGELPRAFWETYSAMANGDGGVVFLGLKEEGKVKFKVYGIEDTAKVLKALWDGLNNREQVSCNLLTQSSVKILDFEARSVIKVTIPRAKRSQRPIYVGRNPLTGTYQRNYEGDYLCDESTVRRLLAEQVEDERDNKILNSFGLDDLDADTLREYRRAVRAVKPSLACNNFDDLEFLRFLGAYRRDRDWSRGRNPWRPPNVGEIDFNTRSCSEFHARLSRATCPEN
jgi:ATP-dependent DNA helicase RecG